MNNYIRKVCPFCKTEFTEGDEIVVCSSCDMPHHKECWIENQGCTTFGCMGTIKSADGTPDSVISNELLYENDGSAYGFCGKCGARISAGSSFCSKCGNTLSQPAAAQPAYTQPAYTQQTPYQQPYTAQSNTYAYQQASVPLDADLVALIGHNQEYYVPKFQEMKAQSKNTGWNWMAFLISPFWFVYRKMYVYGAITAALGFIIGFIGKPVLMVLLYAGYAALGVFGNYIYMTWLEKNAAQAKSMSEPYKSQFIQANGGVNSNAAIYCLVGWAVLMLIFLVIM